MFIKPSRAAAATALCGSFLAGGQAHAINIVVDYTYDTNNFFGSGNPDGSAAGAQAKAALEAAAGFFDDLFTDSFSAIQTPDDYISAPNGAPPVSYSWDWTQRITHPGNGSTVSISNPTIPADEYRIYAGGRSLAGTTLGRGGPGGFSWNSGGSYYTQQNLNDINAITDQFEADVERRGQAVGDFAAWGGAITFDNDGSADWHYDHTTAPTGSDDDFFSVALHELGHAVGLGASDEWNSFLSSGYFTGPKVVASHGPTVGADTGHWTAGTMSTIYGTTTAQEAAMDPNITSGTRKVFTDLDVDALDDIGWDIAVVSSLTGDYNGDSFVSQADLDLVLLNWGDSTIPAEWTNPDVWDGVLVSQNELDGVLLNWGNGTPPTIAAQTDLDSVILFWGDIGPAEWTESKLEGGLISQSELDGVLLNWGNGTPPPKTAIPEPTTAMAFAGLAGAMGLRRRR